MTLSTSPAPHAAPGQGLSWRWWPADVILAFMLSGLLVGPLFTAIGGPLFGPIGTFVYWLGLGICPEPLHHFPHVAGFTAIVCARCIAAIGGLVVVRWLYARPHRLTGWWARWSWPHRLAAMLPVLALWQLDIHAVYAGWWDSLPWVQSVSGVFVGLALGLLIYPVLIWLSRRWQRRPA